MMAEDGWVGTGVVRNKVILFGVEHLTGRIKKLSSDPLNSCFSPARVTAIGTIARNGDQASVTTGFVIVRIVTVSHDGAVATVKSAQRGWLTRKSSENFSLPIRKRVFSRCNVTTVAKVERNGDPQTVTSRYGPRKKAINHGWATP